MRRATHCELTAIATTALVNLAIGKARSRAQLLAVSLCGSAFMLVLSRAAGATTADQGLAAENAKRGLLAGAILGLPAAIVAAAGASLPPARSFYRERWRVVAERGSAPYELLIRMPLATAAGEELIFRSSLESIFRLRRPQKEAALLSAALFGAWHILPALDQLRFADSGREVHRSSVRKIVVVAVSCGLTAGAALVFTRLKDRTGSVLTPIIVHYAINSGGLVGGWLLTALSDEASEGGVRDYGKG